MERGRLKKFFIFSLFLALTSTGGYFLYQQRPAGLSAGLASGNGRLEAVEVDIATKIAGRLAELGPREGDMVEARVVVARLDAQGYRVWVGPAWADYPSGNDEADAARMNAELQRWIAETPGQYHWLHRRFKTRPPGAPGLY